MANNIKTLNVYRNLSLNYYGISILLLPRIKTVTTATTEGLTYIVICSFIYNFIITLCITQ